jgi:hypothetical protein
MMRVQLAAAVLIVVNVSSALGFMQPSLLNPILKSSGAACSGKSVRGLVNAPTVTRNRFSRHLEMTGSSATLDVEKDTKLQGESSDSQFACPQCQTPFELTQASCSNCGAPFKVRDGFVDLTPESTKVETSSSSTKEVSPLAGIVTTLRENPIVSSALALSGLQFAGAPIRQELFRTPLVSYLYERGWRQNFATAGFPGIDKEFDLAMDFFQGEFRASSLPHLNNRDSSRSPTLPAYDNVTEDFRVVVQVRRSRR